MKSLVCVDANVIIRTLVPGTYSEQATALWEQWEKKGVKVIAPTLFAYEVTSTLRRLIHLQEIKPQKGEKAFKEFMELPIHLSHKREFLPLAWKLAKQFKRPRVYDTAYVALAQLRQCDLWTADERLYKTVKDKLAWVKWIGDYKLET